MAAKIQVTIADQNPVVRAGLDVNELLEIRRSQQLGQLAMAEAHVDANG
jgi:hypothetical protein